MGNVKCPQVFGQVLFHDLGEKKCSLRSTLIYAHLFFSFSASVSFLPKTNKKKPSKMMGRKQRTFEKDIFNIISAFGLFFLSHKYYYYLDRVRKGEVVCLWQLSSVHSIA